jgi:hypothetical protein
MNTKQAITVSLFAVAIMVLGIIFLFLPDGWNLIPLFCIAVAIAALYIVTCGQHQGHGDTATPASACADSSASPHAEEKTAELGRRLNRAFGPLAAGIILDALDLSTFGPFGLAVGLPIGCFAGYWMGQALGLRRSTSLWCAAAAGLYCTMPGTEFIPLATIVGACARFSKGSGREKSGRKRIAEPSGIDATKED